VMKPSNRNFLYSPSVFVATNDYPYIHIQFFSMSIFDSFLSFDYLALLHSLSQFVVVDLLDNILIA
jgi:hypothetical protein